MTDIFIPDPFTTCNEYIDAERANKFKGAEIKKIETERVRWACVGVLPVKAYPIRIDFVWWCPSKRIDPDNIAFAKKFILDGLQKAGVIKNDSWDYTSRGFSDTFRLAKEFNHDVGVGIFIHEWTKELEYE